MLIVEFLENSEKRQEESGISPLPPPPAGRDEYFG